MPEVILPCPNPKCVEKLCRLAMDDNCYHFVECPTCGYHGPESRNSLSAIAAHNTIPRSLTWTYEPPKVAGDCYVRTRPDESEEWDKPFVVFFSDGYLKDLKPTPLMQFAGPIAPPVEG